jgi:hypothetical protein
MMFSFSSAALVGRTLNQSRPVGLTTQKNYRRPKKSAEKEKARISKEIQAQSFVIQVLSLSRF